MPADIGRLFRTRIDPLLITGLPRHLQLFAGLVLLGVTILPVWLASVFPSQDGPVHVYLVDILRDYSSSPYLQEFFDINWNVEPNFLIYPILYALLGVFDGPTAEKILVTLIGLAFVAAAVYTVRSLHQNATALAVLLLPLTYHHLMYMGFYNYSASLSGFLFGLGYWFRHRLNLTSWRIAGLTIIVTLTTLAHLMGFLFLAYTIAVMQIVLWLRPDQAGRRPSLRYLIRQMAWLGSAFVPALLLAAHFFWRYQVAAPEAEQSLGTIWLARQLVAMSVLFLFNPVEIIWLGPLLAALAYLMACAVPATLRRPAAVGLVLAIVGLIFVYFLAPVTTKGVPLHDRIQPVLYIMAVLWVAACYQPEQRRRYVAVVLLASVVTVANGLSRAWHHVRIDAYIRDYLSLAAAVGPETAIVGANNWRQNQPLAGERLSWRVDPFRHMPADLVLGKRAAFLGASLLSHNRYGYFPIDYRPEIDFITPSGGWIDLNRYNHTRRHPIDYMVLWPVVNGDLRPFGKLVDDMAEDYKLIAKSTPLGLAYLYRYGAGNAGHSGTSDGPSDHEADQR